MRDARNRVVKVRRFGGPDGLEVVDTPLPTAGWGEVRVRVLVSKTGCKLPGELDMMRSTSEVAACCSSASASFFSSSARGSRLGLTRVLAFVLVERRPPTRLRFFAALRDKVTSSA